MHLFIVALLLCLAASQKRPLSNEQLAKAQRYIRMRELNKIKEQGGSVEDMKDFLSSNITRFKPSASATGSVDKTGYQKFVGKKGSLDQRLRSVIAYKRESNFASDPSGLSRSEERDLEQMMENDDDEEGGEYDNDEELIGEDEDDVYERLVMQVIERNKLNEIKRNFLLDKKERSEDGEKTTDTETLQKQEGGDNIDAAATYVSEETVDKVRGDDDSYTPARSSWGVFQRPRDISKAYGGGRSISKEEMDAMDDAAEQRERAANGKTQVYLTSTLRKEKENEKDIRDALGRSRNLMRMGSRKEAVASLEKVQEALSYQTDLGGEALLELGMALETVDRSDESRKIYGKLAATSWSTTIRRNSLQLIQGLDITKQIRKDVDGLRKPAMDMQNMYLVSAAINEGLRNEWDDYKRKDKSSVYRAWYGQEQRPAATGAAVDGANATLAEALGVLLLSADPLKQASVGADLLRKCIRKVYLAPKAEKIAYLRQRGYFREATATAAAVAAYSCVADSSPPPSSSGSGTGDGLEGRSVASRFNGDFADAAPVQSRPPAQVAVTSPAPAYRKALNGTWDLALSCRDDASSGVQLFESGSVRRSLRLSEGECSESHSEMWGLSTVTRRYTAIFDDNAEELILSGDDLRLSKAPFQRGNERTNGRRDLQVVFCDEGLLLTREVHGSRFSESDLYVLWKKMGKSLYKKY